MEFIMSFDPLLKPCLNNRRKFEIYKIKILYHSLYIILFYLHWKYPVLEWGFSFFFSVYIMFFIYLKLDVLLF